MSDYITFEPLPPQRLSARVLVSFVEFLDAFGEWHPRDFRLPLWDAEEDC